MLIDLLESSKAIGLCPMGKWLRIFNKVLFCMVTALLIISAISVPFPWFTNDSGALR